MQAKPQANPCNNFGETEEVKSFGLFTQFTKINWIKTNLGSCPLGEPGKVSQPETLNFLGSAHAHRMI